MIEISYDNVMNGLNSGTNMSLIVPTTKVANKLFINACNLWYIKGYCFANKANRSLTIGYPTGKSISIQVRTIGRFIREKDWRGFRGVFLIHPKIEDKFLTNEEHTLLMEMNQHNLRYLQQWRP